MIKIMTEQEANTYGLYITEDCWDYIPSELDYLLEEHNEETFVLKENALWEVEEL